MSSSVETRSGTDTCGPRIKARFLGESATAQFARFVFVGASSNILYAGVFIALAAAGSFTANIAGIAASTVLANELHRRHTFHAVDRVGWLQAQWEAGGLALVGLALGTAALAAVHVLFPGASSFVQILAVIGVSAATGALRFVALRGWVF
ncbi:GtrA family protein [Rhodococcoides yunnanense]|uniref:GtrA family protein n=1 Tax=Rhodococcoides yunnanense TaxID=278209 RepID=UPI0009325978|nr:GtrA family protein [Rhodococcus yunnanensis]